MSKHRDIELQLYDYVRGELSDSDSELVEAHLRECRECRDAMLELKEFVQLTAEAHRMPSDERSVEFWNDFANRVEDKTIAEERKESSSPLRWYEEVFSLLLLRWRQAAAFGAAVSLIAVAFLVWRFYLTTEQQPQITEQQPAVAAQSSVLQTIEYNPAVNEYLRKSKMVLIGISNMKLDSHEHLDLSTEQEVSRQLVHQARVIRGQPLDLQSARLIDDVQQVLIDLSNLKDQNNVPGVEIIRSGIHQENLLFKIRMAEAQFNKVGFESRGRK